MEGEREGQIIACLCMRAQRELVWNGEPSPPLFIVGARGGGLGKKPKRGAPPPNFHTKGGRGAPWRSPSLGRPCVVGCPCGGPHLPTCHPPLELLGKAPKGGPPNQATKRGLPPKGFLPYSIPRFRGILSPFPSGHDVFPRVLYPKKFRKVPEHFRHPPKFNSGRVPNIFGMMVLSPKHFRLLRNTFRFSLWNIFSVSETFPVTFSQTPFLVLSR